MGEWSSVTLSELADISTRKGHVNGDVVCLNMDCVESGSGKVVSYADSSLASDKLAFSIGDVLFAKLRPYLKKYWLAEFNGLCSSEFLVLRAKPRIRSQYLYYVVSSDTFVNYNNSQTYGSKMPRTSWGIAKQFKYRIPELLEQDLILSVLTAADEAIATSRALVEKYAVIKQGLMQDLLSGKVRLAGFTSEWESLKIGNLLEFKNGLNKGKEFFGSGVPIVNYMDVYTKAGIRAASLEGRVNLSKAEIKRFEVRKGDVFFTRTSETPEEVGYAAVLLDDIEACVFSGFVLRGRPKNDKLDIMYCKYCFGTPEIRREIMRGCTHTTRALTNGTFLSTIPIRLPKPDEQHAIAKAIMSADERLEAERKRLAKLENIKRGLMDDLLTNKVSTDLLEGGREYV